MGYDERAGRDAGEERPTMTDRVPILVELCAGTAALSLRLEHPRARPPVSRMGAKTGYADVILRCMGLRPGQGADRYLWCEPDAGVRLLLHAYRDRALATAAAEIIRGWADEEPRALWERLRAEGPAVCPPVDAREVAREILCVRWSFSQRGIEHGYGGPGTDPGMMANRDRSIGCESTARLITNAPTLHATISDDARKVDPREVARVVVMEGWRGAGSGQGGNPDRPIDPFFRGPDSRGPTLSSLGKRVTTNTLPATIADDARSVDPREVARWALSRIWGNGGEPGVNQGWNGGYSGPGDGRDRSPVTIDSAAARFCDAPTLPATIADDARAIDPPQLPPGVVVYIDPPYLNTTGYAHAFPRSEWVPVVRRWREAGAMVVVSEAEPIPELMADGWHAVDITGERKGQKRTFSRQQAEWLTMSEPPRWRPSVQMGLWSRGSV